MKKDDFFVFRTVIEESGFDFDISYKSKMIFVGSCFSENIGSLLEKYKFKVDINPFGIIYNPISVAKCLSTLIKKTPFTDDELFYYNELWHSYSHHGKFSGKEKEKVLETINHRIVKPHVDILKADILFITLGTSWVYKLKENGLIVSNCHKIPNYAFERVLIELNETVELYQKLLNDIQTLNPQLKIIFSISPIRHLKDGLTQNSLSKSLLRFIIHSIISLVPGVYYFPSFEIVTDDLRDYRYYDTDMIHPNESAIQYIFRYFEKCFFDATTIELFNRIKKIIQAKEHLPFNFESSSYKDFMKKQLLAVRSISEEYPDIDFTEEINHFK
jgi:hypothetical protein